jgi:hypothetical protein
MGNQNDEDNIEKCDAVKRHDERRHSEKRHSRIRRKMKSERESKNGGKKCDSVLRGGDESLKFESENDSSIQTSETFCEESKSQCSDVLKNDVKGERDERDVNKSKLDDVTKCNVADADDETTDGENCQEIDTFIVPTEMSLTKRCTHKDISSQDSKQVKKKVFRGCFNHQLVFPVL